MRGTDTHGARRARPHLDLAARRVGGDVEDGVAVVVPAKGHVHNVNVFSLFALILLPGGADDPQHQHREHHRLPCRGVGARTKHAVTVFGVTNVARRTKLLGQRPPAAEVPAGRAGRGRVLGVVTAARLLRSACMPSLSPPHDPCTSPSPGRAGGR